MEAEEDRGDGEDRGDRGDGGDRGDREDGANCVGAGFTTIFAVTPRCN